MRNSDDKNKLLIGLGGIGKSLECSMLAIRDKSKENKVIFISHDRKENHDESKN